MGLFDNFDWKKTLGTVAPGLATAVLGPLGGLATKAIVEALGLPQDASEAMISDAIKGATPEQLLALKQADQTFKLQMRSLDIKEDQIAADDRKDSRARAVAMGDWSPIAIGVFIGLIWVLINYTVLTGTIPFANIPFKPAVGPEMVGRILGYIDAAFAAFYIWLYGSNRKSHQKDDTIANLSK